MKGCSTCGSFGHRAGPACPYNEAMKRQDPHRLNPPRPKPKPLSDPELRGVTRRTVFLIPPERIV
jgi:hypothetical protein